MKSPEQLRADALTILEATSPANDDLIFLTAKHVAAIFQVSEKTLERWRQNGGGPVFKKISSDEPSVAPGRRKRHSTVPIRYSVRNLRNWIAKDNWSRDDIAAEPMGFGTLEDVRSPIPWALKDGKIHGQAQNMDLSQPFDFEWLSLEEAVVQWPWVSQDKRANLALIYRKVIDWELQQADEEQLQEDLEGNTAKIKPKEPDPCPECGKAHFGPCRL